MVSNTYFCFVLSASCVHYVAISLDCPFLITSEVFTNVYFKNQLVLRYRQINLFLFDFKLVIFHLSLEQKPGKKVS